MKRRGISVLVGLVVLMVTVSALPQKAAANPVHWIAAGPGDWSTAINWNPHEPVAADDAYINNSGTAQITQAGEVCAWLYLGEASADTGVIEMSAGALSAGSVRIGLGGTGTFTHTGGTFTANSTFRLGNDASAHGNYHLSSDGQLVCKRHLVVGYDGHGVFDQGGGGVVLNGGWPVYVGERSGSHGTYDLSGGTLEVTDEHIGRYGTGGFTHSSGTHTIHNALYIGDQAGAVGTYQLSSAGQLDVLSMETVGRYGIGYFTQTGGDHTVNEDLYVGRYTGSKGTFRIEGGALDAKRLYVGVDGTAIFEINNAAGDVTVTEFLRFGTYSTFTAVAGAAIHMNAANFANLNTDEADLQGLENLNLFFEGTGEAFQELEAAGEDKGDVPGGWVGNFALGTLTVAADSRLRLVDKTNNGNRGGTGGPDEALYVGSLVLEAGAILDLNHLSFYYQNLTDHGGIILNGEGTCADDGDCASQKPFCVDHVCVECRNDGDCGPEQVCLDGQCERQGLRNPLGNADAGPHRPVRRDDEMFLAGLSSTTAQTELAIGRDTITADYETSRAGQLVVAGEKGRILGITPEQVALVSHSPGNPEYHLDIVDLFAEGLPVLATYSFTPANPASRIDVAVGDLDNVQEHFPSLEYHDEVALVYEIDDGGTRYAELTILNYSAVEPPCGQVDPKPGPTVLYTRRLATPLEYQDGTANQMAVEIGDFDNDGIRDVAVGVVDATGRVILELFTLTTDAFGRTSIGDFMAPHSTNCCRPRPDEGGCQPHGGACEQAVCNVLDSCCHDPNQFPFGGGWDEDCASRAWSSEDCPCGVMEPVPPVSTGILADQFEIIAAGDLDLNPGRIYHSATEWTHGDQLAVAGIDTSTFSAPYLHMEVWSYDDVAGFTKGINNGALYWTGGFSGVHILPDSRVCLKTIGYSYWHPTHADELLVALVDTEHGPAVDLYVFDGQGDYNDSFYSNDPDWPQNLSSQPATTTPTGANITTGRFIRYRSRPTDTETILISDPQSPSTSERPGRLVQLGLSQWEPDYYSMHTVAPFIVPETGELIPVGVVPVMHSIDVDGDSGYYRKTHGSTTLYLGEPTLFSFDRIQTLDLILSEPPKHIDYIPALGGIMNISQNTGFYTQFSSAEQQEESASKETRTDFTTSKAQSYNVSTEASVGLFGIGGSVETSVGQTFENTHSQSAANFHSSTSTITLTQVSRSESDDQLASKEQIVDMWRYPVLGVVTVDDDGDPLPDDQQPANPFFDLVIPGPVFNTFGPGKLNDAYQPYHINGNILSYPVFSAGTFQPPDVGVFEYGNMNGGSFVSAGSSDQPIWAENAFVVGGFAATQSLSFSNAVMNSSTVSVSDTHKTSLDMSVKATVSGSYGIFSGSVSSSYSYHASNEHTFTDTRSASRTNSTSVEIAINIPSIIPAERGYKFFPAWYVTPSGAYKVTHAVSTTEIGEAARLFWESTYQVPDPALDMPHRIVADANPYGELYYRLGTDLSRKKVKGFFIRDADDQDLFGPPAEGDLVQLDLRVYNLSVASPVCGLAVRFDAQEFYYGQEIGNRIPLGQTSIPYIPARDGAPPCPPLCRADTDQDDDVDQDDIVRLVEMLLNAEPCVQVAACCAGDMNDDGVVNGLDIEDFVQAALTPAWNGAEPPPEPGAPDNMRYAHITWDTTGFGPIGGSGLRTWLIYATLDPNNTIPGERHELADRYNDPLRNFLGQPLDPLPGGPAGTYLEKGQNNTGWTSVSVAPPPVEGEPDCEAASGGGLRRSSFSKPAVWMAPESLVAIDPVTGAEESAVVQAYVNQSLMLRAAIYADAPYLHNGLLRVFDGDPQRGGKLILNQTVMGLDAANGTYEYFTWQPTDPGRHSLFAQFVGPVGDPRKGNAYDTLIVDVVVRGQAGASGGAETAAQEAKTESR
jgi:hypothetical protein